MVAGGQRLSFRYNDFVTIQLLSRQTTELYCMVIYWRPDEYLYDIIFLYYVRTQTAKLPCTYKLRPVIPGPPQFPDAGTREDMSMLTVPVVESGTSRYPPCAFLDPSMY